MFNSKTNKRVALGSLASIALMGAGFGLTAEAQPAGNQQNAAQTLAACIQGSKSADILLVFDQTGSLVGRGDQKTPTDPDAMRVKAAKAFAHEMARYAEDNSAKINVKLAGFDEQYHAYGGWSSLQTNGGGSSIDGDIDKFADRTQGNYTDYAQGFSGAAEAMADGSSPCQSVMFFSDGLPTREGSATAEDIVNEVCEAEGPAGRLRSSNIQIFTIGLGEKQNESLRRISEGQASECSGAEPNGQHLDAKNGDELLAAFRQMVPNNGSIEANRKINEDQAFTLDNSITSVRVSTQPDSQVKSPETLVAMLTPPGGQPVELKTGEQEIAGHKVVVNDNASVPGGKDIDLDKGAGEWAGSWKFNYKPQADNAGEYHVKMLIEPGLSIKVNQAQESEALSLKSDQPLSVSLVNKEGAEHPLEGTANLNAEIVTDDGTSVPLGSHDIRSGKVEIPLDKVEGNVRGTLRISADITTKSAPDAEGSALSPIKYEKPISVVPANTPNIPASATLNMTGTEGTMEIPVSGPGKVWIEPGTLDVNGTSISYTADHDSGAPLELARDEQGTIVVTAKVDEAVDAAIKGVPMPVSYVDADGNEGNPVDMAVNGSVNAPVNKTVFGITLVAVVLLGILIPLALLYLIRFLTGKIPTKPGLHVLRLPVTLNGDFLHRSDNGREFDVDYDKDFIPAPRVVSNGKSVDAAGATAKVRAGWNPLVPAQVIVASSASLSDDGKQKGHQAVLPLAVHNHWFAYVSEVNPADAAIYMLCDESISPEHLARMVDDVRKNGPARIEKLTKQAQEAAAGGAGAAQAATAKPKKKLGLKRSKGAQNAAAAGAAGAADAAGANMSPGEANYGPWNSGDQNWGSGFNNGGAQPDSQNGFGGGFNGGGFQNEGFQGGGFQNEAPANTGDAWNSDAETVEFPSFGGDNGGGNTGTTGAEQPDANNSGSGDDGSAWSTGFGGSGFGGSGFGSGDPNGWSGNGFGDNSQDDSNGFGR